MKTMHILPFLTAQNFILAGVFLHLAAALAKTLFKTPQRQAQIDAIETKVDIVLGQVQRVLPPPGAPTLTGKQAVSAVDPLISAAETALTNQVLAVYPPQGADSLSLKLHPLPTQTQSEGAGGAS